MLKIDVAEIDAIGGQEHLTAAWDDSTPEAKKEQLLRQVSSLNAAYPGGLRAYTENARKLLAASKAGTNPLEGWAPALIEGTSLEYGSAQFLEHEAAGLAEADGLAFVLVAGGLGERLGFSGIKVALPWQLASGETYLELYIRSILALQEAAAAAKGAAVRLPLAIMVSDDTAKRTEDMLKANVNFGMAEGQITLLKQEKVPCLSDAEARLTLDPKDPHSILTKPHGHGDVHFLLHSSGVLERWRAAGQRWIYFFQDTNSLAFKVLPAVLGVSQRRALEVNSVCIARTPGEAIGGIMKLSHADGREMTISVEYNQIDALLKATVEPRGDVAGPDGFSPYPGSINQLLFALRPYAEQLQKTGGQMPEFVNPKYVDETKMAFKSPTRLECMMQDYPKSLDAGAAVSFSVVANTRTYTPVKTNLVDARVKSEQRVPTYSAASGESDAYASACEQLAAAGVPMPPPAELSLSGVRVADVPHVVIDPSFGVGVAAWREKLPTPAQVRLERGSSLVMRGDLSGLRVESLHLRGALTVRLCKGARVTLRRVRVRNAGWAFKEFGEGGSADEALAIRGYELERRETRDLVFDEPGEYTVEDPEEDRECFGCNWQ